MTKNLKHLSLLLALAMLLAVGACRKEAPSHPTPIYTTVNTSVDHTRSTDTTHHTGPDTIRPDYRDTLAGRYRCAHHNYDSGRYPHDTLVGYATITVSRPAANDTGIILNGDHILEHDGFFFGHYPVHYANFYSHGDSLMYCDYYDATSQWYFYSYYVGVKIP